MYFEKQEAGSLLCAQHCLNNVLQQFTYTEFDLADIAKKLDQAENATLDVSHQLKKSYNFDDTGYFSISVLERALEVWDLSLVRWRGEAMREYQEHPEEQVAFILNLSSHWFPLRRFSTFPPSSSAIKRWYNLNSFLPQPEWISPTYLRMVLTQAEEEGYSVFVVRKTVVGTREGEDAGEGQGWQDGGIGVLPECLADTMAVELGEPVGRSGGLAGGGTIAGSSHAGGTSINPDIPTVDFPSSSGAGPSSPPARRRRRQEDLVPEDPIAIDTDEYSRPAATRTRQSSNRSTPGVDVFDNQTFPLGDGDEDESIHSEEAEGHGEMGGRFAAGNEREDLFGAGYNGPTDFQFHSRSYDDEDEALQAALKASMDDLPPDWQAPPELPPKVEKPILKSPEPTAPAAPTQSPAQEKEKKREDEDIVEDEDEDVPAHEPSADEIRRRRLAKFGGQ
nr:ataxin-3 [Kwoniella bestiolae CBS 10118]OCF23141.1 ataxin-3 [Kwoniella bestiolae CBS 10118]